MMVSPTGSVSMPPLAVSCSQGQNLTQTLGFVIPDGSGGALASTSCSSVGFPQQFQVTDVGGSGATATISTQGVVPDMVLGDQGSYFVSDGAQITAVNESNGSQLWNWQPSEGTVHLIAATAGGGVAVLNMLDSGQQDVVRLDSSDNATYDTWGTIGGSAGYGVLSNASYWINGTWMGIGDTAIIEGLVGNTLGDASGPYTFSGGNGHDQGASKTPTVLNFLPSFIESQVSTIPNTGIPPNPPATADFPCYMDSNIRNKSLIQYSGGCTAPSNHAVRVDAQYLLREAATAEAFRSALRQKLDAVAFIGHSVVEHINQPNEFSYGINFYYPLWPGTNPGDQGSWDIEYNNVLPDGAVQFQELNHECRPPNSLCDGTIQPQTPKQNALLPLEKQQSTVSGLGLPWNYANDLVTTATTPGPPHARWLLVNKVFPDAHVLFIGACSLNPSLANHGEVPVFLQMWDIHDARFDRAETRDRAIILPVGNEVQLANAASVWRRILFDMTVSGMTVQGAVADANANNPGGQQFAAYGNQNVKFQ
jgi:hypothetical protein